jgi:hypothetical protein
VRFIRDTLDINVEMFGNYCADFANLDAFGHGWDEAQVAEDHDQPPIRKPPRMRRCSKI